MAWYGGRNAFIATVKPGDRKVSGPNLRRFAVAATLFVVGACSHEAGDGNQVLVADSEEPPNILFILVDDMGWTDLEAYGNQFHDWCDRSAI